MADVCLHALGALLRRRAMRTCVHDLCSHPVSTVDDRDRLDESDVADILALVGRENGGGSGVHRSAERVEPEKLW